MNALFLTWLEHRRTREICRQLDIPLAEVTTAQRGWRRYRELIARSRRLLNERKPATLLVQSPSLILAVMAVLWRRQFGYRLLVDAHNEAVEPYLHRSRGVRALTHWVLRRADGIIVTNRELAEIVRRRGGRPLVLPDRVPEVPAPARLELRGTFRVAVIATFAGDEPFEAVLEAARTLDGDTCFFVTGNPAKILPALRKRIPSNVTLTGFLSEADYWSLLASCDVVMDLTAMAFCLVCGSYEALALEQPLILSDDAASRHLFGAAARYTANTPQSIAACVRDARNQLAALRQEAKLAKPRLQREWDVQAGALKALLEPAA